LFAALLGFIINQADRLITLSQRGLSGLAIYNVASVGSGVAGYAPSALVTVLLPSLAALLSSNDMKEMRSRIRISTRYVSLLANPIAFGLAGIMEIPLRIFGSDYLSGLVPGVILSVATGLTALSAVYAVALLAQGNLRWYAIGNVLGLVALFLIAGFLTPIIGLAGPAVGRAGLMAVVTLVFALGSSRAEIFEVDIRAFVFSSISAAIMMVFFLVILSVLHGFLLKIAILPLLVGVGLAIYVLALRMFRFVTIDDIEFIGKLLPRRLHGIILILARLVGIDFPRRSQLQPP
jgi:O-antigen/teichoic acid export membrane protein